jgi:SAM-dependent methyltransferase
MTEVAAAPGWAAMTAGQVGRWDEVLRTLAEVLAPGPSLVVVDGHRHAAMFADRLADALNSIGQECTRLCDEHPLGDEDAWLAGRGPRTVALADGPRWRDQPPGSGWDVVIWLRTPPLEGASRPNAEHDAHVVVDLHDMTWPVIRRIDPSLADRGSWYLAETRAFFAVRAATWDARFGDDMPAYAAAVDQIDIPVGGVVVDVGCGTGRALPALRQAVSPSGTVIGVDITEQMLATARRHGRAQQAQLVVADARHLPLPDATVHAVFAAGLIGHVPEMEPTLTELARITADDGCLALFHPSGRAALAARHGRELRADEPLAKGPLGQAMSRCGWRLDLYDDPPHRFLALATRRPRNLGR